MFRIGGTLSWICALLLLVFVVSCGEDSGEPVGPSPAEIGVRADRDAGAGEDDESEDSDSDDEEEDGEDDEEGEEEDEDDEEYVETPVYECTGPAPPTDPACFDPPDPPELASTNSVDDNPSLPAQDTSELCPNQTPSNVQLEAFCNRQDLTVGERQMVQAAVDSMAKNGDACESLAADVQSMLDGGRIWSFPTIIDGNSATLGFGDKMHPNDSTKEDYIQISDSAFAIGPNSHKQTAPDSSMATSSNFLQMLLAHEANHAELPEDSMFVHPAPGSSADTVPDAWTPDVEQCGEATISS